MTATATSIATVAVTVTATVPGTCRNPSRRDSERSDGADPAVGHATVRADGGGAGPPGGRSALRPQPHYRQRGGDRLLRRPRSRKGLLPLSVSLPLSTTAPPHALHILTPCAERSP